ncbi:MAG: DUF1018 domain-containing protein [Sulfuricellaceae bacterium]|nr:DUF1018 domain-containing protein [Sulfuricellaceae bacterium]
MKTVAEIMRCKMYAKIAIARKAVGMSEDEYRDLLFNKFKKRSATELSRFELDALFSQFVLLGFKPVGKQPNQAHKALAENKTAIERKIGWQLGELGKGWDYAYGIWEKNWKHEASAFELLSVERLRDISSSLERTIRFKKRHAPE